MVHVQRMPHCAGKIRGVTRQRRAAAGARE